MKYGLENASLNYIKSLLDNEKYYTEELEDSYVFLSNAIKERNKLEAIVKEQKELIDGIKSWLNEAHDLLYYEDMHKVLKDEKILEKYGFMFTAGDVLKKVELLEKILKLFPKEEMK